MCDCYTDKCAMCGCEMKIHIGNWCTDRENIYPYCHRCSIKIKKQGLTSQMKVFEDKIERTDQVEGGIIGENIVILCKDFDAYGVNLN